MKKTFKLSVNGKEAIALDIEGDDDLVDHFVKKALMESIDSLDTRKFFTEFFINGIKHEIQVVSRGANGKFTKSPTKEPIVYKAWS